MENKSQNVFYKKIFDSQLKKLGEMITVPFDRRKIELLFLKEASEFIKVPTRFDTLESGGMTILLPEVEAELIKAGYIIKKSELKREGYKLVSVVISWEECNEKNSKNEESELEILPAWNVENLKVEKEYKKIIGMIESTNFLKPYIICEKRNIRLKGTINKLINENFFVYEKSGNYIISICDIKNFISGL